MIKKIVYLIAFTAIINTAVAQSKEEAAVTAAVDNLRKAMIDADKAGLQKITAEGLSYGHSSGRVEDKATFIDNIVTGKSDFVTMDLTNQTVSISGDAAIVRHNLSGDINDNGKAGTVKLYVMLIWQKQKGQWKLLARQAAKLPV